VYIIKMEDNPKLIGTAAKQIEPEFGETGKSLRTQVKNKVQITWKNITITAVPPQGKCKPKNALKERKEIIRGVSGTVQPG